MSAEKKEEKKKGRITGVGGIFFHCPDPEALKAWYAEHFGVITDEYGMAFGFRKMKEPRDEAYLQWTAYKPGEGNFEPSNKELMINYRVEGIEELVERLRSADVPIIQEIKEYEYGKFAHIMDPQGMKIELWEPVDSVFTDWYQGKFNSDLDKE